jgi:A/G-specific adenine glycosylase
MKDSITDFSALLLRWYAQNGRRLPWRATRNPYAIWVSEIILQQTRVAQGMDYFQRFMQRFPDFHSLAAAPEDEVMKAWQGLGYYSRARNLHAAARVMEDAGVFPATYEEVLALPGVGEYTAAAICSFAYGMPVAVVDGNVYRVLSRYLGIDTPIDSTAGKRQIAEAARLLMDVSRPADYNQAIMDFGALQCTPASPCCQDCPMADSCAAWAAGTVDRLPVKARKTKVTPRYFTYIYVRARANTYIKKRTADDIWRNLYEFPLIESEAPLAFDELLRHPLFCEWTGKGEGELTVRLVERDVKHVLSHRVIHADFYEVEAPAGYPLTFDGFQCVKIEDLHKFPVSRLMNQFFSVHLGVNS